MTPRGGCQGQGVLIEIPKLEVDDPNVSGPVFRPILSFVCVQAGDMAFAPGTGAQLYAEWIATIICDILHQQVDEGVGMFKCEGTVVEEASDPEFQYTNAFRVTLKCAPLLVGQTYRVPPPAIAVNSYQATLSCSDAQALLYWTADGTFPGKGVGPSSQQYTAPFTVASGQVIRYAAYRQGFIGSVIRRYVVP